MINSPTNLFLYLIQDIQVATRSTRLGMTAVFHTWSYDRFTDTKYKLGRNQKLSLPNPVHIAS